MNPQGINNEIITGKEGIEQLTLELILFGSDFHFHTLIFSIADLRRACQQRNLKISRHYCMNGNIINKFWKLKNATTIDTMQGSSRQAFRVRMGKAE